ncbi:MAG: hypothetical protein UD936_06150 [Acutalibacteraceae bacterium]|nr:hypothetical protein [Acutalibacteraceae bacterium]
MLDDILELVLELFGGIFIDMLIDLIPEDKMTRKKAKAIEVTVAILSCVILLICIIGIGMLAESKCASMMGWLFTGISVAYIIFCIILYFVSHAKKGQK